MVKDTIYATPLTAASVSAARAAEKARGGATNGHATPSCPLPTRLSRSLVLVVAPSAPAFKAQKVKIAASLAKIPLEVRTGTSEAELEALCGGQMPARTCVLLTCEGPVTQSYAALRYVAACSPASGLYGETAYDEGVVDQWLEFCVLELEVAVVAVLSSAESESSESSSSETTKAPGDVVTAAAAEDCAAALGVLDDWLKSRTYLVSDAATVADVAIACVIEAAIASGLVDCAALAATRPRVLRWYLTCAHAFGFKPESLATALKAVPPVNHPNPAAQSLLASAAKKKDAPLHGSSSDAKKLAAAKESTDAQKKKKTATLPGSAETISDDPASLYAPAYARSRTRLRELHGLGASAVGRTVTVKGWIRSVREAEKGSTNFVELNDGSCLASMQIVASSKSTANFAALKSCGGAGASLSVVGEVVESLGKGQAIEVRATEVQVLGPTRGGPGNTCGAQFYPLAKKFHTPEHLRSHAHLRPRSRLGSAVVRVRNELAFATHEFFHRRGFLYIHTPLITAADCEGAGEQFTVTTLMPDDDGGGATTTTHKAAAHVLPTTASGAVDYSRDFFGRKCGLTVSGQLNVETHAVALGDCYTFGPTFRAENSHTTRHLAEFWMIEPEMAFADLADDVALATDYLKYCVAAALARCDEDLAFFEQAHEKGLRDRLRKLVDAPGEFPKLEYTDAILKLQDAIKAKAVTFENNDVYWGVDLNSEHERYLTDVVYEGPLVLVNYPKDIKAFYMKLNPTDDPKRATVAAMDILVPKIGEIIGGSQREDDFDLLQQRAKEVGLEPSSIKWYSDLRLYGSVPHAGFGLGFERLVMLVTGVENIRDVIPFPRYPGHAQF